MSVSMDMIVELLPLSSKLQRADNPLRVVLDRTVGEWLDNFSQPFEQLFLMSATGGWLDAHGKDYGVPRRIDESDDDYRQRIIYEKLDHLTPSLLSDVYGVKLFTYRGDFNVSDNTLVSDNPHIVMNESFLGTVDEDTIRILDKKFILDSIVTWINDNGGIDYVFDTRGINILNDYSKIYELTMLNYYFRGNATIMKVKLVLLNVTNCIGMFYNCDALTSVDLSLPNATNCGIMFQDCDALTSVDLDLPNATNCGRMFQDCSALVNVKLNMPKLQYISNIFYNASNLETIDVTIPTSQVDGFKSYVTGLNLQHLTSFKINGEEQL